MYVKLWMSRLALLLLLLPGAFANVKGSAREQRSAQGSQYAHYAQRSGHFGLAHQLTHLAAFPVRLSRVMHPVLHAPTFVATPDWEQNPAYPGAEWYKQAWDKGEFNPHESKLITTLALPGCARGDWFLNFGCHLGIWPLLAATAGCRVVCVEGNHDHIGYIRLSSTLNSFQQFTLINAVVSSAVGHSPFGTACVQCGSSRTAVPATTIDTVVLRTVDGEIGMVVIDVETSDQKALLGAADTIARRVIPFLQVEIWCFDDFGANATRRTSWPGVDLLLEHDYIVFAAGDLTRPLSSVATHCASFTINNPFEMVAVKAELKDTLPS